MLVRVSRNCPWNRCAFCSIYKGARFSLRTVEEVVRDLDAMLKYHGPDVATVFLQDANPILTRPDDLVAILGAIKERFPAVERITTYARSHTLAHRSVEQLRRIREAGLDRVHIGLESGNDEVLELVGKGTTRAQQIVGGQRAREAGFEVSEYWMPGLGGRALSGEHADDSAFAMRAIKPHFIRLRTTAVVPGTPLAELENEGRFEQITEVEKIVEIRRFLAGLADLEVRLESDHMLNLLVNLRGDLPRQLPALLAMCDSFLALPDAQQADFIRQRRRFGLIL
jgi:radical SAM superfamily enzyme YgiQ (UPF0313 family)